MDKSTLLPAIRRGLGELALIFLGITLALAFENWNSDRERARQELNLLAELYRDLDETRLDLERDIADTETGLANAKLMLEAFNGAPVTAQQFGEAFGIGILNGQLFLKTSSYESMKTIGLDLVTNDALRKSVADLHELSLARVMAIQDQLRAPQQRYQDYAAELFALPPTLEIVSRAESQAVAFEFEVAMTESMVPIDYEAVLGHRGLRMLIARLFNGAAETQARYLALNEGIARLQTALGEELERRGRARPD